MRLMVLSMNAGLHTYVVGHTPVEEITRKGNLISCDVFSTRSTGEPIGTQQFPVIDTNTGEYFGVR